MSFDLFTQIGRTAEYLIRQPFGGATPAPDRLLVKPADIWPGDARIGRALLEGAFTLNGDLHQFPDLSHSDIWVPFGISQNWLKYMHSFSYLRDLQACLCTEAHQAGFTLIDHWIRHNPAPCREKGQFNSWRADVIGERLSNWISHYESFMAEFPEENRDAFFQSLDSQAQHLHKSLFGKISSSLGPAVQGLELLQALKGLVYCALALEGRETWLSEALTKLAEEMDRQIGPDGCHISRAPAQTFEALRLLLDIRRALNAGGIPHPEGLQPAIERLAQAVRFFRPADKGLALFHGGQEEDRLLIDSALSQAGPKGKVFQSLHRAGFERLAMGRTLLIFDGGKPQDGLCDAAAHSAPLSFELYYGKDRVLVNCGTHKTDEAWQDSLRFTAAHNALSIDHRNAYEIKPNGHFGRRARRAETIRQDGKAYHLVEGVHDGYVPLNGLLHRRRLYVCEQGHDIRGEDVLESTIGRLSQPHTYTIRFHIHPRVLVSLTQDGHAALLRLPTGIGWRFQHSGGALSLENSVYLGEGCRPRKTKQLVLTGKTLEPLTTVKWALQREGI